MHRILWLFFVMLAAGCEPNEPPSGYGITSVGSYLSEPNFNFGAVSLYGFMVEKNGIFFLYENETISSYDSPDADKLRLQIFAPPNKVKVDCLNEYVSVYGVTYEYIGAISVDDVSIISSLESGDICYSSPRPLNYFLQLKEIRGRSK